MHVLALTRLGCSVRITLHTANVSTGKLMPTSMKEQKYTLRKKCLVASAAAPVCPVFTQNTSSYSHRGLVKDGAGKRP
ncbi:hypothetical protein BaRGS_00001781 [Batillaria attramentaria]|uniref:Secreted protein n=1 Tax=Batillaria attramentaria TaxID=370345 RepID=A0ABD0M4R9_9CAEN